MERLKRIWSAIKGEPRIIIHKVEIIVNGTQDPAEVATKVADIFRSWKRPSPPAVA